MEYFFKASLITAILYLFYKIVLQNDTFFQFNRIFLFVGVFAIFLIPFITIPIYIEYTPEFTTNSFAETSFIPITTEHIEQPFQIINYIPSIYLLGVLGFSIRLVLQFVSLIRVTKQNISIKQDGFTIIKTNENILPFSFFKWIVYNSTMFSKVELAHILKHEKAHVKELHSIDIILTQLSCVVFWFNPFMWLYAKAVKENLEFIADENAIKNTNCKKNYQYTLLKTSIKNKQLAISNSFYKSPIKKRIVMLQKTKSKKINQLKYALVIPVLALFLMNFNKEEVYVEKEIEKNIPEYNQESFIIRSYDTDAALKRIKNSLKKKGMDAKITGVKRNNNGEIIAIKINVKSKSGSTVNYSQNNNKPIESIEITSYTDENGLKIGPHRKSNNSKKINKSSDKTTSLLVIELLERYKGSAFFLDGKKITEKKLQKINEVDIHSISVLTGESTKVFGQKGKNGVVLINTKEKFIEIIFNKNTTLEKLKAQSKSLKENYNIGFDFEIINKNGEVADFKYLFDNGEHKQEAIFERIYPFTTMRETNSLILKYDLKTKSLSMYTIIDNTFGEEHKLNFFSNSLFYINDKDTNEILEKQKKSIKEKGVIIEFLDIKRDTNNRITEIKINAQTKDSKSSYNYKLDGKNFNGISISFYSNGNGLEIKPVLNTF
ncbi:M56 family metallopeptidase [Polaribacter septentrionalilitoris]|uniref:M56 family metallopeptidase n=1 Tax=Polaribacter septentrionalilitoris TaxID=2494657 RepID=UPI001359A007|nr:M56 family metallopeptidase [Polaribacter septentrionalilitoris]